MNKKGHFDGGMLFCGANSGEGFVSFYGDILEGVDRVYIMKGGPGTGKSSFLRQAAEYARERGSSVEHYACSSDPDSLDAIVVDGRIAIVDGTSPHTYEPRLAGARDEIVDLGRFWNSEALASRLSEIEELANRKSECYKLAYRYLDAAKRVSDINLSLVLPYFRHEKASRAVGRLFSDIKTGGGYASSVGMIDSIGMKGRIRLDTYEFFAEKVYAVEDLFGTAPLFLRLLLKNAEHTDTPVMISYDPLDAKTPNALFFPNDKKAFVIVQKGSEHTEDVRVNMRRFVKGEVSCIRHGYKLNKKHESAFLSSALESLREAGEHHFALEAIYSSCMDFSAKEEYCEELLKRIFG